MKLSPNTKHLIFFALVLAILLKLALLTVSNFSKLSTPFDIESARQTYNHSQYNLESAEFLGNINDDLLYSFAGYSYMKGQNPATINPEAPYLFKYLYGLSIIVFGNAIIFQFAIGLLTLALTAYLTWLLTDNIWLSLLALLLLLSDSLFITQLFSTYLDLPHAFTILVTTIIFITKVLNNPPTNTYRNLAITSLFIGLVSTTKLFVTAGLIYAIFLVFVPKNIRSLIAFTLPAIATYLFVFTIFFVHQPSLIAFLDLHIQIAKLYRSYLPEYPWGQLLNIIFQGKWLTWWGRGEISVEGWSVIWPVATLSTCLVFIKSILSKSTHTPVFIISQVILIYIAFNLTHVVFPRYLLSVLPLMISLLIYIFSKQFPCYFNFTPHFLARFSSKKYTHTPR